MHLKCKIAVEYYIVGKLFTGDKLENYLCHGGADITLINENLYNKIKSANASNEVVPYNGISIQSCSVEIKYSEQSQYRSL